MIPRRECRFLKTPSPFLNPNCILPPSTPRKFFFLSAIIIFVFVFCFLLHSPLPLRPTNLRSLNFATWFFIRAVEFLNSAQQFSSFPARTVTKVPSPTSPRATTLNATGNVLFDLQCDGKTVQTTWGHPFCQKKHDFTYLHDRNPS